MPHETGAIFAGPQGIGVVDAADEQILGNVARFPDSGDTSKVSSMGEVFKIRAGSTHVPLHVILLWISNTLEPLVDTAPVLSRLVKQTLIGKDGNHWLVEPLTKQDLWFLDAAWAYLPHWKTMTELERWKYSEALDLAKAKAGKAAPVWNLQVDFQDVRKESLDRQRGVYRKHQDQIDAMLRTGEMKGLTADRLPAMCVQPNITLTVESSRRYLENAGFGVEIVEAEPEKVTTVVTAVREMEATAAPAKDRSPASAGPRYSMPRATLIDRHKHHWPTIDGDLKDAYRNGLSKAKAGARDWDEKEALSWAEAKGKLTSDAPPMSATPMPSLSTLPVTRHRLKG